MATGLESEKMMDGVPPFSVFTGFSIDDLVVDYDLSVALESLESYDIDRTEAFDGSGRRAILRPGPGFSVVLDGFDDKVDSRVLFDRLIVDADALGIRFPDKYRIASTESIEYLRSAIVKTRT